MQVRRKTNEKTALLGTDSFPESAIDVDPESAVDERLDLSDQHCVRIIYRIPPIETFWASKRLVRTITKIKQYIQKLKYC